MICRESLYNGAVSGADYDPSGFGFEAEAEPEEFEEE